MMRHPSIQYPASPKADVVDIYHGVRVEDPYRWLEDPDNPETAAWVDAQNALTRSVLDGPVRDGLVERLTGLYNYPRTGVPIKRGSRYFFMHNTGLQDQPVLYVQDGVDAAPRVLIDPNAMGASSGAGHGGPVALTAMEVNAAGTAVAYGLSTSGSDRQEIFVRDVESGADRTDRLQWAKFVAIAWVKDGSGFYYTRFPEPGTVPAGDEHYFNTVYYHRLGDPQERDALIFDKPAERETVFGVEISDDDRWIVITAFQGSSDKCEIYLLDRRKPEAPPAPLFTGFASAYAFIEAAAFNSGQQTRLFFRTDDRAPRGRIVWVDPSRPDVPPVEVVAESPDKLSAALLIHGTLVASYLENASDRIRLFDLAGRPARHGRSAGDRLGLRHQRTPGRRRDVRRLQLLRLSAGKLSLRLRGEGARAVRPERAAASIPRTTRRHRCGIPRRTARRCRCSWCTARSCRWTASGRCC